MTDTSITSHIFSFVRRERKLTPGQQRALDALWPLYGIEFSDHVCDLDAAFNRHAPYVLEIGFGNGESLAQMAAENPDINFLGVEVHRPGVGHLLYLIKEKSLGNVRVACHDVVDSFHNALANARFQQISLFFPDPWPKKRHHKRRLIQPEFVGLLLDKLSADGILHIATDWDDYADHIKGVMQAQSRFINADIRAALPRPTTKFEKRGIRQGHRIHDLVYQKSVTNQLGKD
ncbi:MAG: tRNA (guanosine(46)-N7)-methyltransferase TrmB [Gammaproteobacteria bacterium]|nr:tRNA (guanosine(46)-N7)-methyltransferase TrmB [Gammaproteobacteria bacterium]